MRETPLFTRVRHNGRCSATGGPLRLEAPPCPPIDERLVELAVRRLRARLNAGADK